MGERQLLAKIGVDINIKDIKEHAPFALFCRQMLKDRYGSFDTIFNHQFFKKLIKLGLDLNMGQNNMNHDSKDFIVVSANDYPQISNEFIIDVKTWKQIFKEKEEM